MLMINVIARDQPYPLGHRDKILVARKYVPTG